MNRYQIGVIVLLSLSFGADLVLHGKPKTGTHNLGATVVSIIVWLIMLIGGGFFR